MTGVVAVDISAEALVRAQANAARNDVALQTIEANVFDFLTDEVAAGSRYDVIALDPPAFAKTKAARDAAWRGYKEINRRALQLLEVGGILMTCSCSYHVSEEDFEAVVADAAADSGITAQIIVASRRPQLPIASRLQVGLLWALFQWQRDPQRMLPLACFPWPAALVPSASARLATRENGQDEGPLRRARRLRAALKSCADLSRLLARNVANGPVRLLR